MKKLILTLLFLLILPMQAGAATYWVKPDGGGPYGNNDGTAEADAWDDFADVTGLSAGDVLQVVDGSYTDVGRDTLEDVNGTSGTAITFQAETAGSVTFDGLCEWIIPGDYWIIKDFVFDAVDDSGATTVIIRLNGTNCQVTENEFDGCGHYGEYGQAIYVVGNDNTIDYNTFRDMLVRTIWSGGGAYRTQIDHNFFIDITSSYIGLITIGSDTATSTDQAVIVEYNLFDNCRPVIGKIINNKGSSNTYRYNVFLNNSSYIKLRGGDDCIIDGNCFFGSVYGVIAYGEGHIIRNNYFEGITGAWVIALRASDATHAQAVGVLVINNTIVNPIGDYAFWLGYGTGDDPLNCTFQNNLILRDSYWVVGSYIEDPTTANFTWTSNLHYTTSGSSTPYWRDRIVGAGGGEPSAGYCTKADPDLALDTTNYGPYSIYELQASSSNALENGTANANVTDDFDGESRHASTPDIGADEYNAGAPTRTPVTTAEVGPTWLQLPNSVIDGPTSDPADSIGDTEAFTGHGVDTQDGDPASGGTHSWSWGALIGAWHTDTGYEDDECCTSGGSTWRSHLGSTNAGNTPAEDANWTRIDNDEDPGNVKWMIAGSNPVTYTYTDTDSNADPIPASQVVTIGSGASGGQLCGCSRKAALVIQNGQVASNLTNFPVLINKVTLPTEMLDSDLAVSADSGGGDICFSSDSAGANRLAMEVVTFTPASDPANAVVEIWVDVPAVSSSADTTIYVWYDNTGTNQPAADASYGSEAVWDANYKGVWHLDETSGNRSDSTSNTSTLTDNNTVGYATGQVGNGAHFEVDNADEYLSQADGGATDISGADQSLSMELWCNAETLPAASNWLMSKWDTGSNLRQFAMMFASSASNSVLRSWLSNDGTAETSTLAATANSTGNWYHVATVYNDTNIITYRNGAEDSNGVNNPKAYTDGIADKTESFKLGASASGVIILQEFDGTIDEARLSNVARAAGWISACYNNQNDPNAFVVEGTPENTAAAAPTISEVKGYDASECATCTADATYTNEEGADIYFYVKIDQNVAITGPLYNIKIQMTTYATGDTEYAYAVSHEDDKTYFALPMEAKIRVTDLAYAATNSLTIAAGTTVVGLTTGLTLDTTLPTPGAAGSLSANSAIVLAVVFPSTAPCLFPGDAATYTAWIAAGGYGLANDYYTILGITDNITVNNDGPAYFQVHELTGTFDVASKPDITIRGINRISGAISNPGANYSGLTYRNPCARGAM